MIDCPRSDVRDLLPDLLHGGLDPRTCATVERHVAACAHCTAELALLRTMRSEITRTAAVNPSRVADAVLRQLAAQPAPRAHRHRGRDWTVAAAAVVLVTGGLAMAGVRRAPVRAHLGTPALHDGARQAVRAGLMFDGGVGDLADGAVEQLLQAVDSLSGVPDIEPPPVLRGVGGESWAP